MRHNFELARFLYCCLLWRVLLLQLHVLARFLTRLGRLLTAHRLVFLFFFLSGHNNILCFFTTLVQAWGGLLCLIDSMGWKVLALCFLRLLRVEVLQFVFDLLAKALLSFFVLCILQTKFTCYNLRLIASEVVAKRDLLIADLDHNFDCLLAGFVFCLSILIIHIEARLELGLIVWVTWRIGAPSGVILNRRTDVARRIILSALVCLKLRLCLPVSRLLLLLHWQDLVSDGPSNLLLIVSPAPFHNCRMLSSVHQISLAWFFNSLFG